MRSESRILQPARAYALMLTLLPGLLVGDDRRPLTFERDVRPVLKEFCFDCHGAGQELKANLDLRLRRLIVHGGESGPAILPGKSLESLIVQKLRAGEMPPKGKKPSAEKIELIARWITEGAAASDDEPEALAAGEVFITEEERAFWSFQPVKRPEIPLVAGSEPTRIRTPIDALLAAAGKRQNEAFQFARDADRRTVIRRLSLGLTGLPPTTREIDAFLSDSSGDAYANLVERLLASPHYGERWARHWLDVAGYADSEGANSQDSPRPWAWQFRDYVIRSLNADKPFDRFVLEQLAGDELVPTPHKNLEPEQIELLAATGFLRMAADGTGSGSGDDAGRNQVVADTLKIVSSALLGLSVECAQCHDHRYDPIPQRDYYQLRAIFEPALNPRQWKTPNQRMISLYTEEDHKRAAEVEAEAVEVLKERGEIQACYIEEALLKELENYPEALHQPLFDACLTESKDRTAEQNALLVKHPAADVNRGNLYQYNQPAADDLKEYDKRAAAIRATKPFHPYLRALAEVPGAKTETRLFHRGDSRQPVGDPLQPAALTIASPPGKRLEFPANDPDRETTGRRLAFANWLTSGNHPLVARVIVNRVWMHHFGRGLVGTPGDFGVLGERPTHPELLDFLADEFVAKGWSLKHLHRLIVQSTVYRQGSVSSLASSSDDDYSRWRVRRLDAETIRDRGLAVGGILDRTMFGQPVAVKANDAGQFFIEAPRRSLYASTRRSEPVTLLHSFDAPVMETNCNRRDLSNAATQALMVMNGDFHAATAKKFAERVHRETRDGACDRQIDGLDIPEKLRAVGDEPPIVAQVAHAFELAFGRPASDAEVRKSIAFLDLQIAAKFASDSKTKPSDAQLAAMALLCHALISSNEFLYVD